jgi:hypothetical protein
MFFEKQNFSEFKISYKNKEIEISGLIVHLNDCVIDVIVFNENLDAETEKEISIIENLLLKAMHFKTININYLN